MLALLWLAIPSAAFSAGNCWLAEKRNNISRLLACVCDDSTASAKSKMVRSGYTAIAGPMTLQACQQRKAASFQGYLDCYLGKQQKGKQVYFRCFCSDSSMNGPTKMNLAGFSQVAGPMNQNLCRVAMVKYKAQGGGAGGGAANNCWLAEKRTMVSRLLACVCDDSTSSAKSKMARSGYSAIAGPMTQAACEQKKAATFQGYLDCYLGKKQKGNQVDYRCFCSDSTFGGVYKMQQAGYSRQAGPMNQAQCSAALAKAQAGGGAGGPANCWLAEKRTPVSRLLACVCDDSTASAKSKMARSGYTAIAGPMTQAACEQKKATTFQGYLDCYLGKKQKGNQVDYRCFCSDSTFGGAYKMQQAGYSRQAGPMNQAQCAAALAKLQAGGGATGGAGGANLSLIVGTWKSTHAHKGCDKVESFCKSYKGPLVFSAGPNGTLEGRGFNVITKGSLNGREYVFKMYWGATGKYHGTGKFTFNSQFNRFTGSFEDINGHRGPWSGEASGSGKQQRVDNITLQIPGNWKPLTPRKLKSSPFKAAWYIGDEEHPDAGVAIFNYSFLPNVKKKLATSKPTPATIGGRKALQYAIDFEGGGRSTAIVSIIAGAGPGGADVALLHFAPTKKWPAHKATLERIIASVRFGGS